MSNWPMYTDEVRTLADGTRVTFRIRRGPRRTRQEDLARTRIWGLDALAPAEFAARTGAMDDAEFTAATRRARRAARRRLVAALDELGIATTIHGWDANNCAYVLATRLSHGYGHGAAVDLVFAPPLVD